MPRLLSGSIILEPAGLSLSNHVKLLEALQGYVDRVGVLYKPGVVNVLLNGVVLAVALPPYAEIIAGLNREHSGLNEMISGLAGRAYVAARDAWLDYAEIPVDALASGLRALLDRGRVCVRRLCITVEEAGVECGKVVVADERLIYVAGLLGHASARLAPWVPGRHREGYLYCETSGGLTPLVTASGTGEASFIKVVLPKGLDDVFQWIIVELLLEEFAGA